jgi:hypothetical protein
MGRKLCRIDASLQQSFFDQPVDSLNADPIAISGAKESSVVR